MTKTRRTHSLIAALTLAAFGGMALAQTTGTTTAGTAAAPTTTSTTPSTAGTANDRLVASFSDLAGSEDNAAALVNGLRTGSAITLSAPTTGSSGTTAGTTGTTTATTSSSTTFTPPVRPMGYGNVRIALSLARAELASQGITQPTPQQLQTALMGSPSTTGTTSGAGTTTQTQGILQMRASGMGWGQIAQSLDVKLGAVMSGRVPATATASGTVNAAGTTTTTTSGSRAKSSPVTAAGTSSGRGNSGITSAGGGPVSSGVGKAYGSNGAAAGVVSGQGAAHGQGANAGGKGKP